MEEWELYKMIMNAGCCFTVPHVLVCMRIRMLYGRWSTDKNVEAPKTDARLITAQWTTSPAISPTSTAQLYTPNGCRGISNNRSCYSTASIISHNIHSCEWEWMFVYNSYITFYEDSPSNIGSQSYTTCAYGCVSCRKWRETVNTHVFRMGLAQMILFV